MTLAYYDLTAVSPVNAASVAALGEVRVVKGAYWMYVKAASAVAKYDACIVHNDYTMEKITTTLASAVIKPVVIAQFAFAANDFGWAPVGPFFLREDDTSNFKVTVLASAVLDVPLYTTATAGKLDDTSSGSTIQIRGLKIHATDSGSGSSIACSAVERLHVQPMNSI